MPTSPAQAGDFAVVRQVEEHDDYDRVAFTVHEIAAVDADGVRRVRTLDSGTEHDLSELPGLTTVWALPAAKLSRGDFAAAVRKHCLPGKPDTIFPWYAWRGDDDRLPVGDLQLLIRMHRSDLPEYGSICAPIRPTIALRSYANFGSGYHFWSLYDEYGSTGLTFRYDLPQGGRVLTMQAHTGPHQGRQVAVRWYRKEVRFPHEERLAGR